MATTVHHATVKKAAKLGVAFTETPDGGFRLTNLKTTRNSVESWDSVGEALAELKAGNVTWEKGGLKCGVMVASYHDAYEHNPDGPGCNDGVDCAMRRAILDGAGKVDVDELQRIGDANGLWNPEWSLRNPGMQRMNLANRLRAFLRNNADAEITLGSEGRGRFGVAFKPATRKGRKAALAAAA